MFASSKGEIIMKRQLDMEELGQVIGGMGNPISKTNTGPRCSCGSTDVKKQAIDSNGRVAYKCNKCGATFYVAGSNMFRA